MKRSDDLAAARGQALLAEAIEAHGGAARWLSAHTITTAVQLRGAMPTVLFPGRPLDDYHFTQTVDVQRQRTVMSGFPQPGTTCTFTPHEVTVESDGQRVDQRSHPRNAFRGRGAIRRLVRWDTIDSAYFVGYAMSNYLTHPYSLGRTGINVWRGPDWRGETETWRRLYVRHPAGYDSHCRDETLFVDEHGLVRRHEYVPDILTAARMFSRTMRGWVRAANFPTRHQEWDGLVLPTFRRIMLAPVGRPPVPGFTPICAQISEIRVSFAKPESPAATATEPMMADQ